MNNDNLAPLEVAENAPYDFIYRIKFRKIGQSKFISHLDLVRTMTRAIRRARLPIWYTKGFNRHPYLTFAAPLSLGFEGLDESMDLRFVKEISREDVVLRLNAVLPPGLEITSAGLPVFKAKELTAALYNITIDFEKLETPISDIEKKFLAFQSQDEINVEKLSKKKKIKIVSLKSHVDLAKLCSQRSHVQSDCTIAFDILLPSGSVANINPNLVVGSFLNFVGVADRAFTSVSVVREKLFAGDNVFV